MLNFTFKKEFTKPEFKSKTDTSITFVDKKLDEFSFNSSYYPSYSKVKILSIEKIPTEWRECYDVKLDTYLNYDPCDAIGLLVPNSHEYVDRMITLMNLDRFENDFYVEETNRSDINTNTKDADKPDINTKDIHRSDANTKDIHRSDANTKNIHRSDANTKNIHRSDANTKNIHRSDINTKDINGSITDNKGKFKNAIDTWIKIERKGLQPFTYEGSLYNFIKYRMDLTSIPKKRLLFELSKTSNRKEELEFLCSREGNEIYLGLIRSGTTLLEIIEEFSCRPTVEDLISFCEILKPRYYSLIQKQNEPVRLLIGTIVDEKGRYGHVSNFIKKANVSGDPPAIEFCFRKSQIYRNMNSRNLICFCTGTGIAPYLAFFNNPNTFREKSLNLIYGYRNEKDNLAEYFQVENYIPAKSSKGERVTDFVEKISEMTEDVDVFICGNSRMQKDLFDLIKEKYSDLVLKKRIFFDSWL